MMNLFIVMLILSHKYYLTRNMSEQNSSFWRKLCFFKPSSWIYVYIKTKRYI